MVRLSAAVMAHPDRAAWAENLAAHLGAPVVWDSGGGPWETGRRALLAHHREATHHLVVQDDAIVCRDLIAGLRAALVYAGRHPVGLYITGRPEHARMARAARAATETGTSWMRGVGLPLWGVASAHPVETIAALVASGDAADVPRRYDLHTGRFYARAGVSVWYTWPSLVDHRPGMSLLGNTDGRRAHRFLGADASALSVDWSTPPHVINT